MEEGLNQETDRRAEHLSMEEQLIRDLQQRLTLSEQDRARLQRARDELAAALLEAEARAAEAEERAAAAEARAAAAAESDAGILLDELDRERETTAELAKELKAVQAQGRKAAEQLLLSQQTVKELEQQLKRGATAGGMRASTSAASLPEEAGSEGEGGAQRLRALKASRDKLIAALDAQSAEVERLATENAALAEALAELREIAAKWEAQAEGALGQSEALKDLLEESATWSAAGAAAGGASAVPSTVRGSSSSSSRQGQQTEGHPDAEAAQSASVSELAARCEQLESQLLLENARNSQLDLQVRALCMELTRAAQASGQMQAALLPLLGGVEARLVTVLSLKPPAAVLSVT